MFAFGPKPSIRCLVGYAWPGGVTVVSKPVILDAEEATELIAMGWAVIPDSWDLEAVARWEQWQRAVARKRR